MSSPSRLKSILYVCSFLVTIYSISLVFPLCVGMLYGEEDVSSFLFTFVAALTIGIAGLLIAQSGAKDLKTRDGFLVAVLFWLIFSAVSATPFLLDSRLDLTLSEAVFEGVSGITTTGASVLNDIDLQPKSILYYRAQLNFLGGLGIIVLAIAILPLLGIGGAKLYQSETPGPLKEDKLTPRLTDTAKHLWLIYSTLAVACAFSYWLAGMNVFNAICHSLSTVSLGGFSPHGASLGFYQSYAIEVVGGVFSILAGVNFALYFIAVHRRTLSPILKDNELRFFLVILAAVVLFTGIELYRTHTFDAQGSMVHGFFQAISIMTDNGLGSAGYPDWPAHIVLLLLGASFFGGCVGSTCGGIKAMRFLVLRQQSGREVKQLVHPNGVFTTKIGGRAVPDRVIQSVWGLFFLYIFFACLYVWGLVALGYDFVTAFGTVAACLNNMGVGYGETGGGFGVLSPEAKWLMCSAMLFGRLEIFPILIVVSRAFWRF